MVELPAQNDKGPLIDGTGVGLTVIVNVFGVPGQPALVIKLPRLIGLLTTVTVLTTVFVAVLITDTLLEPVLAIYTFVPSGLTDMPIGPIPAEMVAITAFVAVLITDTLEEPLLDT